MTLDWRATAHDCAVLDAFSQILADEVWHDGNQWWSRQDGPLRPWATGRRSTHLYKVMYATRRLPVHPYWDRVRHAMASRAGAYKVLAMMQRACRVAMIDSPPDLNVLTTHDHNLRQSCLCWNGDCIYPPVPPEARLTQNSALSELH